MPLLYKRNLDLDITKEILFIDNMIVFTPKDIRGLTDRHLIMLLRWWEEEGEEIFEYEHNKYNLGYEPDEIKPGIVYFARRNSDGIIKIGFTSHPRQRYEQLKMKYKEPLEILLEIESEDPFTLEQQIHEELKEYNIEYEWFDLPDEVIEEYKSNGRLPIS